MTEPRNLPESAEEQAASLRSDWNDDWNAALTPYVIADPPPGLALRTRAKFNDVMKRRRLIAASLTGLAFLLSGGAAIWLLVLYARPIASGWATAMEGLGALTGLTLRLWQVGPEAGLLLMALMWALMAICASLLLRIFRSGGGAEINPGLGRIQGQGI